MSRRVLFASAASALLAVSAAAAKPPLSPETVSDQNQALLIAKFAYEGALISLGQAPNRFAALASDTDDDINTIRRTCAMGRMPAVIAGVAAKGREATARHASVAPMPPADLYCLAVIEEARRRNSASGLYINLALQEQGYDALYFSQQAQLLKNNEPGRTFQAVLMAANAGQASYVSVAGQTRDLSCPLALDAGETWASTNTTAPLPQDLTSEEASDIAQACYGSPTATITVRGSAIPAQRAGLFAGAWIARNN